MFQTRFVLIIRLGLTPSGTISLNFHNTAQILRRGEDVAAVLGPTNTGKTHQAIERMLEHENGMIGLPLRLLAREVYGRVAAKAGLSKVALLTGEEKIVPPGAIYWVCTVEAMPRDIIVQFVAIDEVQLAADLERGHVFTDRILNMRGTRETYLFGADTIRPLLQQLLPGVSVSRRARLSTLTYTGSKKISRLPPRSAVVAFSAAEVYEIAELIRRQKGGTAVVMGALSPRTRNAQVALYQNGDVDYLVATDAIGMGLNLDVEHVAFAQRRKFDGFQNRELSPAELGQIAGRAGRYLNDGTFGVTGRLNDFDAELVERLEAHDFEPLRQLQWRSSDLDFSSLINLRSSLEVPPKEQGLARAPQGEDQAVLELAIRNPRIADLVNRAEHVERLWEVCQIPDYRKLSMSQHAELCIEIADFLLADGFISDDWLNRQIEPTRRLDGDIDILSTRLAYIRTWSFVANRADWLKDPAHWRERTRTLEDQLSDALHEKLTQRFVDRRTSVLARRLRDQNMLEAQISQDGEVQVEGQTIGALQGFCFVPDTAGDAALNKTLRSAAAKTVGSAILSRAQQMAEAPNDQFVLASDNHIRWIGHNVARLVAGESEIEPELRLNADEHLTGAHREWAEARLKAFLRYYISLHLKPLFDLRVAESLSGIARGLAFQLVEALGILDRTKVAADVKGLDQTVRGEMRKLGVRFGAHHIYLTAILKPKPRALAAQLWLLKRGLEKSEAVDQVLQLALSGRTTWTADTSIDAELYRVLGYKVLGPRAVRIDILERLADLIRPLASYNEAAATTPPPEGRVGKRGFLVTPAMTSLLGSSPEDMGLILRALGYVPETRQRVEVDAEIKSAREAYELKQASASTGAAAAGETTLFNETSSEETLANSTPSVEERPPEEAVPEASQGLFTVESVPPVIERASQALAEESLAASAPQSTDAQTNADVIATGEMIALADNVPQTVEIWHFARPQRHFEKRAAKKPYHRPRPVQADGAAAAESPLQERERKPFRKYFRKEGKPQFTQNKEAAKNEKRPERKPFSKDRNKDRGREQQSERRLVFSTEVKNDNILDPNNPFAKLAALKAQMGDKS